MSGGFGGGFTFGAPATTSSTVTFGSPATFGTAATQQTNLPTFGSTAAAGTTTGFGNLQQQQPAQTGGLFNLNNTANTSQNVTQQPASNTGFGFSFGGASQPAKTTAPVFGSTTTSAAPTSTVATGFGTGNLFSTASTTTNATQSLTQTPQANTFGSLTTTSTAAPTSTPAFSLNLTQPTQTNSLLNNTATQNLTSSAPTNQSSLTTSTAAKPASTGFNFGSTGTTTTQTTSSTNQATSTTSNASLSIPQSTSTTLTSSQTTATTQQPQQPPQMTFKQLEGYINVWLNELNQMEKDFQTQSQTINSWDSLLVNNGIKISNVNENLDILKEEHKRIDQQLDFVISQQNELEQLLEPLEKTQVDFNINDTASTEREFTYSLVDTVSSDLLGIGTELQNFIKKLNETKANQDANDPLSSIGKILNSHLDALQYIEHQINVLKKNIDS